MPEPARVSARAAAPILAGLRSLGADVDRALAKADLDPSVVADPEARVSHERVVHLWQIATEQTGNPDFGLHVSGLIPPGAFGVVEYSFRKSPTVLEGLERVSRYFRLHHDVAQIDITVDDEQIVFEHKLPGARTLPRAAVDFILSNQVQIIRDATDGAVSPAQVWVDYAPPEDQAALTDRFRAPVRFLRGKRALVFSRSDGEQALSDAEPGLCAILDSHTQHLLSTLPTVGTLADRVREVLAAALCGGNPTAQGTARTLKTSVRTLSRRLQEEQTSHKQLLEQLRRELASAYLRDRTVAISEVAYLLGFSEPSAFHRAFRRWSGQTPAEFRDASGESSTLSPSTRAESD